MYKSIIFKVSILHLSSSSLGNLYKSDNCFKVNPLKNIFLIFKHVLFDKAILLQNEMLNLIKLGNSNNIVSLKLHLSKFNSVNKLKLLIF